MEKGKRKVALIVGKTHHDLGQLYEAGYTIIDVSDETSLSPSSLGSFLRKVSKKIEDGEINGSEHIIDTGMPIFRSLLTAAMAYTFGRATLLIYDKNKETYTKRSASFTSLFGRQVC